MVKGYYCIGHSRFAEGGEVSPVYLWAFFYQVVTQQHSDCNSNASAGRLASPSHSQSAFLS